MADNIQQFPTDSNKVFAQYKFEDSNFMSSDDEEIVLDPKSRAARNTDLAIVRSPYSIPLKAVRSQVNSTEFHLDKMRRKIEKDLLSKINVSPFVDPDLESSHYKVWLEASKFITFPGSDDLSSIQVVGADGSPTRVSKDTPPNFICFDQVAFCEKYQSTASRVFLKEYYEAINHSTFSYLFHFRNLLKLFENENACIKKSLINDFGSAYENESQQKIALQYDTWSKMALHYARRISEAIVSKPGELPSSEVGKVTKEQAAKLQGFFAIRVNAVDSEISDLINALKRDMVDNCDIFYDRYLRPSISAGREIGEYLDLIFRTTDAASTMPSISKEVSMAENILRSNFKTIYVDMMERISLIRDRSDGIFNLVREKRKYCNYISQLSRAGAAKQQVLSSQSNEIYPRLFRSIIVNQNRNDKLLSSHSDLDDLDKDSHPQYLLKDGGTVTGDISVSPSVTIDGVDLSEHSHTGVDGSRKIRSIDIDWEEARINYGNYVASPIAVSIDRFIPDIVKGGIPVVDVVVSIEMDENIDISQYEFDVIYRELS